MCGIIGLLLATDEDSEKTDACGVSQLLFDGLTVLQHRGQDAAGIVTADRRRLHLRKDNGLVKDVFQQHHMVELRGNVGIGHCRYPTAGTSSCAEAQPLYTNYPFGICVAHNGNITNTDELTSLLLDSNRHVNTDSDSELLLNIFAEQLTKQTRGKHYDMVDAVFGALTAVMQQCKGGYAGLYLINGFGLVGFRDPHGIRPLVFGCRQSQLRRTATTAVDVLDEDGIPGTPACMDHASSQLDYCICSESVAIDTLGFKLVRDVRAGEAIFIDMEGNCHSRMVHASADLSPCIFEYVYFARPDSIMDGVPVYETRLRMGEKLAEKILRLYPDHDIDVVIPIPDTSRTAALQAAYKLNRPFREGFIKNRYIPRTFIMPGQETRRKSVRLKLNTIKSEFTGRNVLLMDDSIVRGTTAHEIVQMARDAGAKKVYFSSAAPPIRYPNIYGIDIPTREELMAFNRTEEQIAAKIGCDWVVYQDLDDLEKSITEVAPPGSSRDPLTKFDTSCFSGMYVTGESIGDSYFTKLHAQRNEKAKSDQSRKRGTSNSNGHSNDDSPSKRPVQSNEGCESMLNHKNESEESLAKYTTSACEPIANNGI